MAQRVTLEMLYAGQRAHEERLEQIDKRFEQVDKRFEQVDKRFEQVDKRFEQVVSSMEFRFDKLEGDVHQLRGAVGDLQDRMSTVERTMADGFNEIITTTRALTSAVTQTLADLSLSRSYDRRITALEAAVFSKPGP